MEMKKKNRQLMWAKKKNAFDKKIIKQQKETKTIIKSVITREKISKAYAVQKICPHLPPFYFS